MGKQKRKWTSEEEDALLAGVAKHGDSKWKNILTDPEFAQTLCFRSKINLKDKWRNLTASAQDTEKRKTPRAKNVSLGFSPDAVEENSKAQERYSTSIFEALSTMKDLNGSDIDAICNFIQQRDEEPTPQNFKRLVGARLRSLVSLGKLEKTRNGFKIKKHSILRTNTPSGMVTSTGKEDDVVHIIASILADAENKSFLATVAVMEAERVSKITEETNSILLSKRDQ